MPPLRRFNQFDSAIAVTTPTATAEFRLDYLWPANEDHSNVEVAGRSQRAINFGVRRVVAAHSVEDDLAR
jgi:hypothetical protein